MTTIQDHRSNVVNQAYYDEPEAKPPPMLVTGPLAWMRENLFGSTMDTILTIVGTIIIVGVTVSFIQWSINWANWFSVTYNLRLFMIGRVEPFMEGRVLVLAIYILFIVGVNLAAWARVSLRTWVGLAIAVALLFIIPAAILATIPRPPTYLSAGQSAIVSGSVTETPIPRTAFIANAGSTITLRAAGNQIIADDASLAQLHSFTDRAVDAVRNSANNRLNRQARIAQLQQMLAGDALTSRQREALSAELEALEIPPPVHETLAVNRSPIEVSILDGATLEPLANAVLTPDSEPLTFTVPEDGWYVLEKTVVDSEENIGILAAHGVYPIFERNFLRSGGAQGQPQRVVQYIRATDNFIVEGGRPRMDGQELPMVSIIEHQYRNQHTFSDYLTLMLAPLLNQINRPIALFLLLAVVGYYGARAADRQFSSSLKPRRASRRAATWLWITLPVVAFILIVGVTRTGPLQFSDPQLWGGLLLTMMLTAVGIVGAFPIGVALALGRRSSLPVVSTFCTLYIELVRGVPLITVLFMSMLLVPFVAPWLGGPDTAPVRAMVAVMLFSAAYLAENVRGGLQSLPPGQEEAGKALGLAGWQVTLFITLPQALRAVIPALVGQFIALYKDTSLVAIVGLIDLTGVTRNVSAQTEFQGLLRETYVFISVIYFVFSYVMSIVSRRIESSGSGAARRI